MTETGQPVATKQDQTKATGLVKITGWGHHPVVEAKELRFEELERITTDAVLSRGLGRSYGDSSLPATTGACVANSTLADRFLSFDPQTGILRAEAGLPLWRLNRTFLPRGWFTPVSPGTHFVTLGGMVAADVHGKNHHVDGCFGAHVLKLKMRVADGRILECSATEEPDLFFATLGGMGLTGHILEVEFKLKRVPSPWIWQESVRLPDFDSSLRALRDSSREWPYTVMWNDFLVGGDKRGRGLLMKGRWAEAYEAPHQMPRFRSPFTLPPIFPSFFLQPWMWRIVNTLNYAKHGRRARRGIVHPETFFYPLDMLQDWNNAYGKRGFIQYQCVLPYADDNAPHHRLMRALLEHKAKVFLTVIKDCGAEGKGMLSYPKPGISYALDLPIDSRTQGLVDDLNELVIAEGGRIYLAKDTFTRGEHFRKMDPRVEAWSAVRRKWDPTGKLRSAQSVRVFGDQP